VLLAMHAMCHAIVPYGSVIAIRASHECITSNARVGASQLWSNNFGNGVTGWSAVEHKSEQ
jgi:hypothetical protein